MWFHRTYRTTRWTRAAIAFLSSFLIVSTLTAGAPPRQLKRYAASMFPNMTDLQPNESTLTGSWVLKGTEVVGDEICLRIEWLVKSRLEKLAKDSSGWETLYRDPHDGRLWEHTYPQSHMHGGGPPQLNALSTDIAASKYGVAA